MNSVLSRSDRPFLPSDLSPVGLIERAAFASFVAAYRGDEDASDVCREFWPNEKVAPLLLARATATVGTTGTSGWASQLVQQATGAFFASLSPTSAAAALVERGTPVSLGRAGSMILPVRSGAPVPLPWVAEGDVIPVRIQSVAPATLEPRKMGTIVALSRELAKRATGEAVFTAMLREEASLSLDAAYFSAAAGSSTVHAGLLNGVTPIVTAGNITDDLAALASAVGAGGSGQVAFIAGPGLAAAIMVRSPDLKVPVLGSVAVPEDRVIAVDPLSLAHGFGDDPEISASESAVLHMTDDASGSVMAGDPVRSLFQTAGIALRLIVDVAFAARRAGAVAYVDGVDWYSA